MAPEAGRSGEGGAGVLEVDIPAPFFLFLVVVVLALALAKETDGPVVVTFLSVACTWALPDFVPCPSYNTCMRRSFWSEGVRSSL